MIISKNMEMWYRIIGVTAGGTIGYIIGGAKGGIIGAVTLFMIQSALYSLRKK